MKKWEKKLTAKQRSHLKDLEVTTLAAIKRNVELQATHSQPCWECVAIGRKLGFTVELTAFNNSD